MDNRFIPVGAFEVASKAKTPGSELVTHGWTIKVVANIDRRTTTIDLPTEWRSPRLLLMEDTKVFTERHGSLGVYILFDYYDMENSAIPNIIARERERESYYASTHVYS